MIKSNTYREGDRFITVTLETKSAVIDYTDILDATEVVHDDNYETPWDSCDGLEHTVTPALNLDYGNPEKMQGYCYHGGQRVVITLQKGEDWGTFDYWRAVGASKQFAAEKVAENRRNIIKQLVKWYEDGWGWYGVKCEFDDEHKAVWGIEDEEYADEMRNEIADQMADTLRAKGYTVVNEPEPPRLLKTKSAKPGQYALSGTVEVWKQRFKDNLSL